MKTVTQGFVSELIDFAPTEETKQLGFATTQLEGTVATFNMLARNSCAYLADEVGMGKTYVALGVMALLRYFDPTARIIVIAPRENIQRKWVKELQNFVRMNWKIVGNRVKSLQGGPAWEPVICNRLLDFAHEANLSADRDFFLRMTSFSLALKDLENRRRLRRQLRQQVPWIESKGLSSKTPEGFRAAFGCALNAAVPPTDLVVVDEAHNLKHGFSERGSTRNHIMGLAFGHPDGRSDEHSWYKRRAKRVLLLSATPFEEDYAAIQRQFDIFGFGKAPLRNANGDDTLRMSSLASPSVSEDHKRDIVSRVMLRRVSGLTIANELHTKNMYRREWRRGGYSSHDEPMQIDDPQQRLIVALMQKKVAEILQDERFNNSFQIGMLSSFESFLESLGRMKRRPPAGDDGDPDSEDSLPTFDGDQSRDKHEQRGIDTHAIARIADSYRDRFYKSMPHPKLDRTADSLADSFDSTEKTLVFVRRVATVDELAAKLDRVFDGWIRKKMDAALPELKGEISDIYRRYERERARRPDDQLEVMPVDEGEVEIDEASEQLDFIDDTDEGSAETFFAWFFRGKGPPGTLSGAAFQKNRLGSTSSAYATLFEDDVVAWLMDRPDDVIDAIAKLLQQDRTMLTDDLRNRAYAQFKARSRQKEGYPRLYVFESYQVAALQLLEAAGGSIGEKADVILQELYPGVEPPLHANPPTGFPGPDDSIGAITFITELVKRPELRRRIWPDRQQDEFRFRFRRREQRRELLSGLARLGAAYIDLYTLAIRSLASFKLRVEAEQERPERQLATRFVELLEQQADQPGFHAFYELSQAAENFDLLLAVNFHEVAKAPLHELAALFGATLQRQVPIGRMSGGVNKRLVRQFRMPGFPLVLVTTDVLQEGEDLHTFCRRIVHYGITWTPSAMEQRTGRIDRIGSLVQRRLDGSEQTPSPEFFIQVHYPHLRDTVEVLQVRRVLRRLNRFLTLIHERGKDAEDKDRRIDTSRAILEDLDYIGPLVGPLQSAFPVKPAWLSGQLSRDAVVKPDVDRNLAHLDNLWSDLLDTFVIAPLRSGDMRFKEGRARLNNGSLVAAGSGELSGQVQPFHLEMRSQAAGDATLLRCRSEVGRLDLRDTSTMDRLYELQYESGKVKICVQRDLRDQEDIVSVEGGILFHFDTTQLPELVFLVRRTIRAAARIRSALAQDPADSSRRTRRRAR